jgi:hypothetical protein
MITNRFCSNTLFIFLLAGSCAAADPDQIVQVNLDKLLNARVIITQKDGQLQLADHALDAGSSILITKAAAEVSKAGQLNPLPSSSLIAANARHPEVKLHYADGNGGPQVCRISAHEETSACPVPPNHYKQMQAFFISAQGSTPIVVTLRYADGSAEQRATRVPDFFFLPKETDKGWFVLVDGFGKVDAKGHKTETDHHYVHGFDLNPDAGKILQQIEIHKEPSNSVLNLFALTGTVQPGPSN